MQVFIHPEAKQWTPSEKDMEKISSFFGERLPESRLYLWPRRLIGSVTGKTDAAPYSFRAVTRGNDSNVFVDPTETKASVAFLSSHELTHQLVGMNPMLRAAFQDARPIGIPHHSDLFHLVDTEERFCDGIASQLMGTFYDRAWWRKRVLTMVKTSPRRLSE
jgi:hypothetical protein